MDSEIIDQMKRAALFMDDQFPWLTSRTIVTREPWVPGDDNGEALKKRTSRPVSREEHDDTYVVRPRVNFDLAVSI